VFISASETHNRKNVNKTVADTLATFRELVPSRSRRGMPRAGLRLDALGLPLRGRDRDRARACEIARELVSQGCYEVSLSTRSAWARRCRPSAFVRDVPAELRRESLAMHIHDTRGTALANIVVGLELGMHDVRRVGRRSRRLPLRAGRCGQRRDRGPRLHARRHGRQARASTSTSSGPRARSPRRSSDTTCRARCTRPAFAPCAPEPTSPRRSAAVDREAARDRRLADAETARWDRRSSRASCRPRADIAARSRRASSRCRRTRGRRAHRSPRRRSHSSANRRGMDSRRCSDPPIEQVNASLGTNASGDVTASLEKAASVVTKASSSARGASLVGRGVSRTARVSAATGILGRRARRATERRHEGERDRERRLGRDHAPRPRTHHQPRPHSHHVGTPICSRTSRAPVRCPRPTRTVTLSTRRRGRAQVAGGAAVGGLV
jgi:hypothetical protein